MENDQALQKLSEELGVNTGYENFLQGREALAEKINELITHDFQKLVSILYRVDVSEEKLKQLLNQNPNTDAGLLIADLLIERQVEKIRSRQQSRRDENISDEEKW